MVGPTMTGLEEALSTRDNVRALVVGGCGYVGRRLVEMLCARGGYSHVVVMDRLVPSASREVTTTTTTCPGSGVSITRVSSSHIGESTENNSQAHNNSVMTQCVPSVLLPPHLSSWYPKFGVQDASSTPPSITYVQGDVRRLSDIISAMTCISEDSDSTRASTVRSPRSRCGVSRVFHLASPNPLTSDDELLYSVNVQGTKNVLEACRVCGVTELVYCSSASVVFGNTPLLNASETLPYPFTKLDKYSQTKVLAEKSVLEADGSVIDSSAATLRCAVVRPHMIFGPGDPCFIGGMLQKMKEGKTRVGIGDGSPLVDATYVDNVCYGHILAAEGLARDKNVGGLAYNITNGEVVKFWSMFSYLCGAFGYQRPKYRIPYGVMSTVVRTAKFFGITMDLTPRKLDLVGLHHTYSIERARAMLGYEPLVSLRAGLEATIEYTKLKDSEVLRKVSDATARSKQYKQHTAEGGDAVAGDMRITYVLWTALYVTLFLSIGAAAQTLRLLLLHAGCALAGLSTKPNSIVWSNNPSFLLVAAPLSYFVTTTSVLTWALLAVCFSFLAAVLHIVATRGTVIADDSSIPMVGNLLRLRAGPTTLCAALARQNLDCFSFTMFGKPIVFVTGRDAYEFFFKATDDEVSLKEVYKISQGLFGKNCIYDVGTEDRQQQFHFLSQSLSYNNLRSYVPMILSECDQYFEKWGDKGEIEDFSNCFLELISLTAARCLLGPEIRERFEKDVKQLLYTLDKGITPISMVFPFFPLPVHWARDRARQQLHRTFEEVMEKRRQKGQLQSETPDTLSILMNAELKNGGRLTSEQISGMLTAMFFGGQHTSSATASWLMINLLSRASPEIIDSVLAEQEAMDTLGGINYETITTKTQYLTACLIESLRLSNPLAFLLRYCKSSRYFNGYEFPAGTVLAVCTNEASTNPEIFDEPSAFRPTRWIQNDWDEWRQQYKFLGFGAGKHTCMGRRFAHLQIKTITSYLFRHFSFSPISADLPNRDELAMVIGPDRKYPVKFERIYGDLSKQKAKWPYLSPQ